MASIVVDGVTYEVPDGTNLLHACLSHGLDLPYFCWHPSLGSVGACRQCAVVQYKDEEDTQGRLTMACMTPASDGARVSIAADEAVRFRASVIEWLMLNHPHDCPVCEEGGECHLQDMTVMTGHTFRRYRGSKRTWRNQYLGPFVTHEMNRCITCYRCVRFYRDYAGGRDLDAFGSRDRMFFGRAEDGVLESEFAGNLVEVCPTGVFADKPFAATYTRKWDLASAPSLCPGCGVGCNTLPGERYGTLKRVHNRYHQEVNGYFLCDRGRFGTGFVNDAARLRQAGARCADGSFDPVPPEEALRRAAEILGGGRVAGIGSPRASMESNFALQRLVGAERFSPGFADHEAELMRAVLAARRAEGVRVPTLRDVEAADAVLVLGEDVSNTAPRLALALRQTVRNRGFGLAAQAGIPRWQDAGVRGHAGSLRTPVFEATVLPTRLAGISERSVHRPPGDLACLGLGIAQALGAAGLPPVDLDDEQARFVDAAAGALHGAERPLIVSGTGSGSAALIQAAAAVAAALATGSGRSGRQPALCLAVAECNAVGAALLRGVPLGALLDRLERGELDAVVVLENDLRRRADRDRLERALGKARVVVLDSQESWTAEQADLVLPAASFADGDGTWLNYEGRAQRHFRVLPAAPPVAPAWHWLARTAAAIGGEAAERLHGVEHLRDVQQALLRERPELSAVAGASDVAPVALPGGMRVPRQPPRYSGRTAMHAHVSVHEPKPPRDEESPFAFSMEGQIPRDPGPLLPYAWSPGWNSNQSVLKFQAEVAGPLRGGPAGVRVPVETWRSAMPASPPAAAPEPFRAGERWRVIPLHEVFGSDELTGRTRAIRERAPAPYVVLAPADAERLGVIAGGAVRLDGRGSGRFVARLDPAMPAGAVGVVQGMAGDLWAPPGSEVAVAADDGAPPPGEGVIARG